MSYPQIIETHKEDIQEIHTTLNNLVNLIYPIGSIYMSVNDVSPQTFLGGTWEQIKDTFLLCSGDTFSAGSSGGEINHTLTQDETPEHTHTRGTMNILSRLVNHWRDYSNGKSLTPLSGAFYVDSNSYTKSSYPNCSSASGGAYYNDQTITFDASRSWTGATSSVGGNAAHNNMPPYLAVYVWKRIS